MPRRENELSEFHTFDLACELADRMELSPKETNRFIDEVMTRAGFRPVQNREAYQRKIDDDDEPRDRNRTRRRERDNNDDAF